MAKVYFARVPYNEDLVQVRFFVALRDDDLFTNLQVSRTVMIVTGFDECVLRDDVETRAIFNNVMGVVAGERFRRGTRVGSIVAGNVVRSSGAIEDAVAGLDLFFDRLEIAIFVRAVHDGLGVAQLQYSLFESSGAVFRHRFAIYALGGVVHYVRAFVGVTVRVTWAFACFYVVIRRAQAIATSERDLTLSPILREGGLQTIRDRIRVANPARVFNLCVRHVS